MTSGDALKGAERDPVAKAFSVLRWMIDSDQSAWGVREIARGLDRPPSTIHRALTSLEGQGLVVGDQLTGRYALDLELYRLSSRAAARLHIRQVAAPSLTGLRNEFDETSFLCVVDTTRLELIMVSTVESTRPVRYVVVTNEWQPLYRGAVGLAMLAYLPLDQQEVVLARASDDASFAEMADIPNLSGALDEVRSKGYSRTTGQRVSGVVGIAAPVFDRGGRVVADVGLTLPEPRFSADQGIEEKVVAAAAAITAQLCDVGAAESDSGPGLRHLRHETRGLPAL